MWIEQLIAESTGKEGKGILPGRGREARVRRRSMAATGSSSSIERAAARPMEQAIEPLSRAGHPVGALRAGRCARPRRGDVPLGVRDRCGGKASRHQPLRPAQCPGGQGPNERDPGGKSSLQAAGVEGPGRGGAAEAARLVERGGLLRDHGVSRFDGRRTRERSTGSGCKSGTRRRSPRRSASDRASSIRRDNSTRGVRTTGVFLQITAASGVSVPIPARPYGFQDVVAAQAAGDLAALRSRGRRALRCHLPEVASGLRALESAVEEALGGSKERRA